MPPKDCVRYGGKRIPFLGSMAVGKRQYAILEKIGRGDRQRFWVFDRHAGPRGDFRQILILPADKTTRQHLAVLQRLSHGNPNLPMILECRQAGTEFHLVTTWARGEDLDEYLRRSQASLKTWPSPLEVMKLFRGMAHGLSQLHRHCRVVHGDIRPSNLVFARTPNRLVMIDFGSAWMMEKTVGRAIGDGISEYYAAPEQLQEDGLADFRSDQFSATAVAYELLTGKRPYGGMGGTAGLPKNRANYEPLYKPPSALCPLRREVPRRIWELIDAVVGRGLALDPPNRFQNRSLWLDALEDVYCEVRRKPRYSFWDGLLLRFLGRFVRLDKPGSKSLEA